ncbi:hypothetical protein BVC80_8795g10 [Macleaya cordata]|uniref:P-loop containing nucleoside triphosphate hydrolase n=1 Tax=Macleaya cordata TaxID=56857 RepID=A0A200PVB8_MACCD|nr:hypothetical protein BVC80_8795g10 [Macleaya cordata]
MEEQENKEVLVDDEMVLVKQLRQQQQQMIIAMKGHPGSGKSTLARKIASTLRFPLIDKDDVRDCTAEAEAAFPDLHHHYHHHHHQQGQKEEETQALMMKMMNELSYEVIWRIAETQLDLGLSVVIDSPLSRRSHLDRLLQLISSASSSSSSRSRVIRLVIIECRPQDEAEWYRRLENRGRAIAADAAAVHNNDDDDDDDHRRRTKASSSSHKPATWQELQNLILTYDGCWDYDVGDVPKLVLDTTAPGTVGVRNLVSPVLHFLSSV